MDEEVDQERNNLKALPVDVVFVVVDGIELVTILVQLVVFEA